jgi:hypothetical protein
VNCGVAARSAVSTSIVFDEISGQNCLGKLLRETGHSRVPEPPDKITGMMRCGLAGGMGIFPIFLNKLDLTVTFYPYPAFIVQTYRFIARSRQ